MFVSPKIGFLLMPSYDSENMSITLTADAWLTTDTMLSKSEGLHDTLAKIPELNSYTSIVNWNTITITLNLINHKDRERTTFDIEAQLNEDLKFLKQKWFDVNISTVTNASSMWSSSEVWIKIMLVMIK